MEVRLRKCRDYHKGSDVAEAQIVGYREGRGGAGEVG